MSSAVAKIPRNAWPLLALAIVGGSTAATTTETIYVTAPLAVGLVATVLFFWAISCRRYSVMPWFELGVVYVTAAALYMAYPLIGFLSLNQRYTPQNDGRLYSLQPNAAEAGQVAWLYACHLVSFAIVYLVVRGRLPMQKQPLRLPPRTVFISAAVVYGLIEAFQVFVGAFFNMSAASYAETYLAARRLPLFIGQMVNHLTGAKFALSMILLAALFCAYRKYRLVILAWLLLVAAMTTARLGARTELVLLLMAAAMMYHLVVRPLSSRLVLAIGTTGLAGFLALGVMRSIQAGAPGATIANPFVYASEFETLFGNAIHLNRIRDAIGELPMAFYLGDVAALVPQQLAPFTKIDRADWYVSTFFPAYAEIGGGLAFGTISEAILAGGWLGALAFGAALGFSFAKIHRFYARHAHRFWAFVFYVWVTTLSYQAFRNTTFSLLVLFMYRFIPAFVAVNLLAYGISRITRERGRVAPSARRAPAVVR